MPYLIAILILMSPILIPVFMVLYLLVHLFGRPKYQYHHSICEEDL
jgi:hypothetical protein